MTREECKKALAVLNAAYPATYSRMDTDAKIMQINLWSNQFKHDDYQAVMQAVTALIYGDASDFAPSIGKVHQKMQEIYQEQAGEITEDEAVSIWHKAIRDAGWEAKKEFDKLPELLQKIVGSPTELQQLGMMPTQELNTVCESQFRRRFRAYVEREHRIQMYPPELSRALGRPAEESRKFLQKPEAMPKIPVTNENLRRGIG